MWADFPRSTLHPGLFLVLGLGSLVPRPLPDFISQLWRKLSSFLHSCEIKSGSGLGMTAYVQGLLTIATPQDAGHYVI